MAVPVSICYIRFMQDITVSLNNNKLKVSTIVNNNFKGLAVDLDTAVAADYKVLDIEKFTEELGSLLTQLVGPGAKNAALTFIVEPQDVHLRFVTVNKQNGDTQAQIIGELSTRLAQEHDDLQNYYFNYRKIAPFVFQFAGIKKEALENYLDAANRLGVSLKGVFSWTLLLPRMQEINTPAVFIIKSSDEQIVALSEFSGVFYSGVYAEQKTTDELQEIVHQLSVYKRNSPIEKVYIHNYENFELDDKYSLEVLSIPNAQAEGAAGYDMHLLVDYVADHKPFIYSDFLNFLTALPIPATIEKKSRSLVYVGSAMAILVLVGGIFGISRLVGGNQPPVASQQTQVLSEASESTKSIEEPPVVTLKKEDLKIRVENGAGVAGIAGKTETLLKGLGYNIVSIGNADDVDRVTTLVKFKNDKASYKDMLSADLKDKFSTLVEEGLEEELDYDVLIVVGSDAKI